METSAQAKKSINWKNVLIGVVIGAIVIGLGILIWFLLQQKPSESTPATNPKTATTSAKKDETAGWKTFTSTTFKYSIKYPAEWPVSKKSAFLDNAKAIPFESIELNRAENQPLDDTELYIRIYGNFEGGWCESPPEKPECKEEKVVLAGVEGRKWTYINSGDGIYYFESKKIVIFTNLGGQKELIDKVLSTFRFD